MEEKDGAIIEEDRVAVADVGLVLDAMADRVLVFGRPPAPHEDTALLDSDTRRSDVLRAADSDGDGLVSLADMSAMLDALKCSSSTSSSTVFCHTSKLSTNEGPRALPSCYLKAMLPQEWYQGLYHSMPGFVSAVRAEAVVELVVVALIIARLTVSLPESPHDETRGTRNLTTVLLGVFGVEAAAKVLLARGGLKAYIKRPRNRLGR
jgi:hypothetical protein